MHETTDLLEQGEASESTATDSEINAAEMPARAVTTDERRTDLRALGVDDEGKVNSPVSASGG